MVLSSLVEARVSFARLLKYLTAEELDRKAVEHVTDPEYPILVKDGTFKWDKDTTNTLSNIDLKVK